ncbi:MAG: hypothetical protein RR942_18035 [Romboutsia sp.]
MTNNSKRAKETQLIALLILIPMLMFSFYASLKFQSDTIKENNLQNDHYVEYDK